MEELTDEEKDDGLNRTIIGLKFLIHSIHFGQENCLNRTIIGLKYNIESIDEDMAKVFESNYYRIEIS